MVIEMNKIKIELTKEEDAILYYEKTMGRNQTIRQRAAILYEAGQGAESMTAISRKLNCGQQNVKRVLKRFEENGLNDTSAAGLATCKRKKAESA